MIDWIRKLLAEEELRGMGHAQRKEDDNLGLGWLYYALARIQRCSAAVVVGSYRGFVPMTIAKGLADNREGGIVHFVDPSFWDGFWTDPERVNRHFQNYGLNNIRHYRLTTQEYIRTPEYDSLAQLGLVFIDGHHTYNQARFDYEAFASKLAADAIVLFHDSMHISVETYGGIRSLHMTGVTFFVDELESRPDLEVFDFPRVLTPSIFSTGLTMVRRKIAAPGNVGRNTLLPGYEQLRTGIALFNEGKVAEALLRFTELTKQEPEFATGWLLCGTTLVSSGDVAKGFRCLERARDLGHGRAAGLITAIRRELERPDDSPA